MIIISDHIKKPRTSKYITTKSFIQSTVYLLLVTLSISTCSIYDIIWISECIVYYRAHVVLTISPQISIIIQVLYAFHTPQCINDHIMFPMLCSSSSSFILWLLCCLYMLQCITIIASYDIHCQCSSIMHSYSSFTPQQL